MLQKRILLLTLVIFSITKTFAQPVINSFSPLSGPVGTTVIISGNNFSPVAANNIVYFGAVKATVNAATNNSLSVTVPNGATFVPLTVTTGGLTGYSSKPFITTFTTAETAISDFTFNTNNAYLGNGFSSNVIIVDFDGDGKPDITCANSGDLGNVFYILRNTNTIPGVLSFAERQAFPTHFYCISMEVADLDGDGKQDIVVQNYDSIISCYRNISVPGNINFIRTDFVGTSLSNHINGIHDLDGDGKPELVVAAGADTMCIYKNISTTGTISFLPWRKYFTGQPPGNMVFLDIDADGSTDIMYTKGSIQNIITVFKNDGAGNFPQRVQVPTANHAYGIFIADIDGDGKTDITTTQYSGDTLSIYRNISSPGSILFEQPINRLVPYLSDYCSVGDMNGDGKPDILTVTGGGTAYVFPNLSTPGNIQLAASHNYVTNGSSYCPISSADVDNDNKPDIVIGATGTHYILRNRLDEPNITSFYPETASSLMPVRIFGTNFNNISAIYFGVSAAESFTVNSPSEITALVDSGTTGSITVVQNNGTGSLAGFTYMPNQNVYQCPPVTNTSITSNIIGSPYQWQINTGDGNGFVNMINNSNYTGTNTSTLHLINIPSSWYNYAYRCFVDNESYSWSYSLYYRNYWNGTTGNNWEDASNWSCGTVPDENTNVVINSGTVVINSNVIIHTLTVNPGVNLSVVSGNNLTVTH